MNVTEQLALRASDAIHEALADVRRSRPIIDLPDATWDRCRRLIRQIKMATGCRWYRAADRLQGQLRFPLAELRRQIDSVAGRLDTPDTSEAMATRHDLFRDLVALGDEFDEVDICPGECNVSAVTDAIVLEGIDLGPFNIELRWDELGQQQPYSVIAVDPNPAASNAETTHPHVQDKCLCEGDGRVPIRQALSQGRLFDFFIMVRQILETYNSGSAFVSLDDWHGVDCRDCGRLVHDDERDTCEHCEVALCYDCSTGCPSCDRRCCGDCITSCAGCEEFFCPTCLSPCAVCQQDYCKECLTDEKCTTCRELEEAEDDQAETETAPAGAAVHAVRLGQTVVPTGPG